MHRGSVGILILGLVVALALGCATSRLEFRHLPSADALDDVRPGVTTRSEVLRTLGPPEEMRHPGSFDRARKTTPQHRRILEEGRIFGNRVYTYAAGRRTTTDLGIMPAGPKLLRFSFTESREHRWRIEFDDNDVVRTISHTNDLDSDGAQETLEEKE